MCSAEEVKSRVLTWFNLKPKFFIFFLGNKLPDVTASTPPKTSKLKTGSVMDILGKEKEIVLSC